VLGFVVDLYLTDSILLTFDLMSNPFFQAFKLPSFKHLGGFVYQGRGPDEEEMIFPNISRCDSGCFTYRTSENIKISKFNLSTEKIKQIEVIKPPGEFGNAYEYVLTDSFLMGYDIFDAHEFVGFNLFTSESFKTEPNNPAINVLREASNNQLFTKVLSAKPDGSRFSALYDKFPVLRIYNNRGNLIKEVHYDNPSKSLKKSSSKTVLKDQMLNYMRIKATDKYIYGLFSGETHGQLRNQERMVDDYCSEIHVWDWDGKPIAKYSLDRTIFSFAVSPENDFIIASSVNQLDKLYIFHPNLNTP
jgi:hypothetical protein